MTSTSHISSTQSSQFSTYPFKQLLDNLEIHWRSSKLSLKPWDLAALSQCVEDIYGSIDIQSTFVVNVAKGVVYYVKIWERYVHNSFKSATKHLIVSYVL